MGIFREGFLVRFFLIALAGFTVAIVASARAAEGVDQLGYCSSADKVVSFPDGSVVALGRTGSCSDPRRTALVKLDSSGHLVKNFGRGGVLMWPDGPNPPFRMIALPDGRLVLMGYGLVTRLLPDGSLDPGFDGDGTIDPGLTGFDGKPVLAESVDVDSLGRVLLAGTAFLADGKAQPVIRRYLSDGSPDLGFGTGGQVRSDFFHGGSDGHEVRVDGVGATADGSVIVSGEVHERNTPSGYDDPSGPGNIRYEEDGTFDTSYGDGGFAFVSGTFYYSVEASRVYPDGSSTVAGWSSGYMYGCPWVQLYRFDPDGNATQGVFGDLKCGSTGLFLEGNGFLAASDTSPGGHGWPETAETRFHVGRYGALPNGMDEGSTDTQIGIGRSAARDVTVDHDGNVVAVGQAFANDCLTPTSGTRGCGAVMVIARYTGADGGLDPAFGEDNGMVTIPEIACDGKIAGDGPGGSALRSRCLEGLSRPDVTSASLLHPRAKKPSVRMLVTMPPERDKLFPASESLTLTLPKALAPRQGGRILFRALQSSIFDEGYDSPWDRSFPTGRSVRFSSPSTQGNSVYVRSGRLFVSLAPGSLRKIPRKFRGRKVKITVRASYESVAFGAIGSQENVWLKIPGKK